MEHRKLVHGLTAKYGTRDPFRIAQNMGFLIVQVPLAEMRGFQQIAKRRRFIYINDKLDERQQRLVCAHELGHHFLHRGVNRIFMDRNTHLAVEKYENEANYFSLELVHSDEDLQPFLSRPISDAAAYMGVSLPLAEYRMGTVEPTFFSHHFEC